MVDTLTRRLLFNGYKNVSVVFYMADTLTHRLRFNRKFQRFCL